MFRFSYFDVETPSRYQDSICQIAVITEEAGSPLYIDHLLDPEDDFHPMNVSIHGITRRHVLGKPTFAEVWPDLAGHFKDHVVVGHNVGFDLSVLYKNIFHYGFDPFPIYYIDTMTLLKAKKIECGLGLKESCRYHNIELDQHHDALADTKAAYELFQVLSRDIADLSPFIKKYCPGERCFGYDRALFRDRPGYSRKPATPRLSPTTRKISELKDLLCDISADQAITYLELFTLKAWLGANEALAGNYPFDLIFAAVEKTLADGLISQAEQADLLRLIEDFISPGRPAQAPPEALSVSGKTVCLTGDFYYGTKADVTALIGRLGGTIANTVTKSTDLVLIGSLGSPKWSFGTFGSKVKKAQELRDKGQAIEILREADFKLEELQ